MLNTSGAAAAALGVSQRQLNRSARVGRVVTGRIGGVNVVSDRALVAATRTAVRGRPWNELTVRAALELIERGETQLLAGSERSRLKARLRRASAASLGYQLLGSRASLWRRTGATRARVETRLARELGLAADGGLAVEIAAESKRRARELRLVEDAEGDVLLVECDASSRLAVEAVGLYAFGGTRESSAAEAWLKNRLATI